MVPLIADRNGQISDQPEFSALGQTGVSLRVPELEEVIPIPKGAHLYFLPSRYAFAQKNTKRVKVPGTPVAAILPQGYTRTLLPAYGPASGRSWLPHFGYTACSFYDGKIYVAALATSVSKKWSPGSFEKDVLERAIAKRLKENPDNRVFRQLSLCATNYNCYTAANVFYKRWEAALPVSPSCNATCRGCISKAFGDGPSSPQERFDFVPTLEDCISVAKEHFTSAEEPIMSFGQGCEGEPTLQAPLIEKVVSALRQEFPDGQFNINTNGSRPDAMVKLLKAGLDSIRVSLNSVQDKWYDSYYRPVRYMFSDVVKTIMLAKQYGVFVSLNLLCFPGVTDSPEETEAFLQFLSQCQPDMIQLRNLNIDPWRYLKECIEQKVSGIGMVNWIALVKREFPQIRIGSHTPYIKLAS